MGDGRFLSPGRPLPVQMFYNDQNSRGLLPPQTRSFSSFSPVMPPIVFQPQPMILRADSPIPFLRQESPSHRPFVLTPQIVQQQILNPQENRYSRYSSPVPGTYVVSSPGMLSLPSTSVAGPSHHRNSPMKLMCIVQSPSSQLHCRHNRESSPGAQSLPHPNYQQAFGVGSARTPYIGDDAASEFMARMQQRQGARKSMAADWNQWDARNDRKPLDARNESPLHRNISSNDHRSTLPASLQVRGGVVQHTLRPAAIRTLKLTILSARNLPVLNGACNSYCSIRYGGHTEKTPVFFESINPKWNHVCVMNSNETEVGIFMFHLNQKGHEQLIGVVGFSTNQVLSGVCERAFILKSPDGTAAIGNDGCPAYLDIAVVVAENPADERDVAVTLLQQKNYAHERWNNGKGCSPNVQEQSNRNIENRVDQLKYQQQSMLANQADIRKLPRTSTVGSVHPAIAKYSDQLTDCPDRVREIRSFGSLQEFQDHGCIHRLPDPQTLKHSSRLGISGVPALDVYQSQDLNCGRPDSHPPKRDVSSFADAHQTITPFSATFSDVVHNSTNLNLQRTSLGSTNCEYLVVSTETSSNLSNFALTRPLSPERAGEESAKTSDTLSMLDFTSSSNSKVSKAFPPLHVNHNPDRSKQDFLHFDHREKSADEGRLLSTYASLHTQDTQDDTSWIIPSLYATRVGPFEVSNLLDHDTEDSALKQAPAMSASTQNLTVANRSETFSNERSFISLSSNSGLREHRQCRQDSFGHKDSYSVGIRVSKGPPYYVVEIQSLMDENCVLQGMHGFKYGFISVGDRLLLLDGIPVNDLSSDKLEEHFNGPMLSVCEITLESSKSLAHWKVLAMRHILSQNQGT
jgi:hypothetical protein